ncbi:MAG TPA: hypothetical protein VFT55_14120, partial [Planctomycetota bacterium]|nr:hypothetical protein [Planctomycetota bacterium]
MLVSSWLSAATAAQADVAGQRLEAAAAAFAAKQVEDAAEALLEAWLAIDAVTDDPLKSSLSAKALEIGSAATPEFADRLKLERDIVARIEPVILQLLEARRPSTVSRIASAMPPLIARRYATRIEEIERTIDEKEKQRDHALILAFTAALIHGNASNLGPMLKEFPALDEWVIHRRELAPAAERLAASYYRLKWYRTARRLAIVAIDLGPTANHFAPSDRLVDTCDAALAEERYRIHARPHMDAFRRNCSTQGESRNWDFNGSVWKTPWRGHRALVLSGDPIAGDCSIEVDLGIPKSGGTIQILIAWLDGA